MWYVCVCVTQKWNGKIHIQFQSSTQTQQYSNRNDGVINNCRYFSLFQMRLIIYFVIKIACSSCYIIPIFEVLEMHAESSASIYFLISFHSSKMCTIFCYETSLFVFNSLWMRKECYWFLIELNSLHRSNLIDICISNILLH